MVLCLLLFHLEHMAPWEVFFILLLHLIHMRMDTANTLHATYARSTSYCYSF